MMSLSSFPSKKRILLGDFTNVSFESGATTLPEFDPHAYTPGFSQLLCTCKCCELRMFLLSSSDVAFRRGFSKFSSCCSCGGSSACTSRKNLSPLYHCHAVAVAPRAVTATTDRTKCCWRRCAYGWGIALARLELDDLVVMFLLMRGAWGVGSVARERHLLLLSIVCWNGCGVVGLETGRIRRETLESLQS